MELTRNLTAAGVWDVWLRLWVRLWLRLGAMRVTVLAHTVVFRHRTLSNNLISSIANRSFAVLTALTGLYDAGCWLCCLCCSWLVFARMLGAEGQFQPASLYNGIFHPPGPLF